MESPLLSEDSKEKFLNIGPENITFEILYKE